MGDELERWGAGKSMQDPCSITMAGRGSDACREEQDHAQWAGDEGSVLTAMSC